MSIPFLTAVMRYEDWDILLFPGDSQVPMPEFKTACYVAHDDYGRPLSTLSCFIASLPAATPFRVSVHSWTKPKPSSIIEARRKPHQRVVYTVRVIVDGTRVFHKYYEGSHGWPQEIENENPFIDGPEHKPGHRKAILQFPPFHQDMLLQNSWDAREDNGRIKVSIAERLVSKANSSGGLEFGAVNDIVCFSFQHAPRDILEQTGLCWPIHNPLYLPSAANNRPPRSHTPNSYARPRSLAPENHAPSPFAKYSGLPYIPPSRSEPRPKPNVEPLHKFPQVPHSSSFERLKGHPMLWDDFPYDLQDNPFDDVNITDSFRTSHTSSNSAGDGSLDYLLGTPPSCRVKSNRRPQEHGSDKERGRAKERENHERGDRQFVMTLRDDQFGALMQALSPPSRTRQVEHNHPHEQDHSYPLQATSHSQPPRMGQMNMPIMTKPSAAALARSASYTDFSQLPGTAPLKLSQSHSHLALHPNETTRSPYLRQPSCESGKENVDPNRVPTPHPFKMPPSFSPHSSDGGGMKDHFSGLRDMERGQADATGGKSSPLHAPRPLSGNSIKSRKEGLGLGSPATTSENMNPVSRQDRMLFAETTVFDDCKEPLNGNEQRPYSEAEGMDNSSGGKMFIPGHGGGVGSLGRIEKQLWSALGDEMQSYELPVASMRGGEGDDLPPLPHDFGENGALGGPKRKRGDTMGGDGNRSPDAKMMREDTTIVHNGNGEDGKGM
ncbi:hypothetical protein GQ43DRAFT_467629 [Delitschia confertaspora ATCC 74209]|uniref:Uncharacterized protein n=1 Tax=Delitschia confertaspora ATCC 74209 TaxID=1513339 RepID=A0A9P4MU63_9PLEO|nr:hypothetical protein GQ43DRAFT_467629 [Delitschia confertaspora ATCC 74209]